MATVNKDFKIKYGLIVEGLQGTINNERILTEGAGDEYILDLIGGETLVTSVESTQMEVINGELNIKSGVFDVSGAAAAVASDLADHEAATVAHGATGAVVGTTNTQTLTNKTLGAGTNLSVNLDMNGNKIQDLGTPVAGTDATTKDYVDDRDTATLGAAEDYTDTREGLITTAYQTYADAAEADARGYTDTREIAITDAYEAYADQAEADAKTYADGVAGEAESDAITAAANAAAALYAPLAGATFTGEVLVAANPTQALGVATKQYVDAVAEGLHVHESARVAVLTNVAIATGLENGDTAGGVTLATGNRVLLNGQTNAGENGIYVVQASGSALRAADFDTALEVDSGDFIFVTSGTYANTGWVQTNRPAIIGTDPISFQQFSGAGTYVAGTGLELNGTSFSIDETYTATRSYVNGEIGDLDTAAQGYADAAELAANGYTDGRETAITTAYRLYADTAEADAKSYADDVAGEALADANTYTDNRETAITTAFQNYADLAEADAKLYTDNEIDALDTNDIEEGTSNLYFTSGRAKTAAAELLVAATKTNITITGTGAGLTITAENGVGDSTTTDLAEGTNLYFTAQRAVDALEAVVPNFTAVEVNSVAKQVASTLTAATAGVQVGHAFAKADYRSAEFLVKVKYGDHTEISKVLLTLDVNDNIAITEYGIIGTNGSGMTVSANVSGANVQLLVTTANNNSVITVMGTLLV